MRRAHEEAAFDKVELNLDEDLAWRYVVDKKAALEELHTFFCGSSLTSLYGG